ncbi:MAG: hypothetical protein H3C60_13785 [Sphingomonadaceae bacterium]|nr:hypothetical protein [Sphingomonadaceae bacterium]
MRIQVVGLPSEEVRYFASVEEMMESAPFQGWTFTGMVEAKKFIGFPMFKELFGPMEGEEDTARYETWPAQQFYST